MLVSSPRREPKCIERAGGRAEMPLGQMQVDGSYLEGAMAEQYLNGAQVGAGFKKMGRETMAQSVGMNAPVVEAGAFGGDLAGSPENLGRHRMACMCASGCLGNSHSFGLRRSPRQ